MATSPTRKEEGNPIDPNLNDLELLSDSATRFLSRRFDGDIYQFISARLYELAGEALIIVSEFDPHQGIITVRAVTGAQADMEKLASLLGREPVGLELNLIEEMRSSIPQGKLVKVGDGLFGLSFKQLPPTLCREIEQQLGLGDIFAASFAAGDDFFGTAAILTRSQPRPLTHPEGNDTDESGFEHNLPARARAIEAFIGQAALALKQARDEDALRRINDELEQRVQERTQELLKSNQLIVQHAARADTLVRFASLLNAQLDLKEVLKLICEETAAALSVDATLVELYDEQREGFFNPCGIGLPAEDQKRIAQVSKAIFDEHVRLKSSLVVIPDTRETINSPRNAIFLEMDIRTVIGASMKHEGKPVGGLNIFTIGRVRQFTEDELALLQGMAGVSALAIVNSRLIKDLQKSLAEEQAIRQQLIQAEKHTALSRMVASVAHEINNPLQTIKNCLYLAQQENQGGPMPEYLEMANSEVRRITNLVSQLRDIYRPTRAEPSQRLVLSKLLDEVHALLLPHLTYHQVAWQLSYPPEGTAVNAVADQLKQVFLNISLNAIEAMEPGGGSLTVSTVVQDRAVAGNPNEAEKKIPSVGIIFKDTGPGITRENLSRVFEPLYTSKETGNGLGLAISYDLIKRMNGQITVESQVGEGASFIIWLPMALPAPG
jgi:signal transduction histidine kinase